MAINTYSTLRTAVAGTAKDSWAHRSDVLSNFDTFLDLAQEEMYQGPPDGEALRVREMEVRYTASLSTSSRFLALPANYLEMRRAELEYSSVVYPLTFVNAPSLMEIGIGTGTPNQFTITSQIEFNITPDVAYTMELQMYGKVADSSGTPTPLSSTNTTHSILTRFPSIFLYGCLYQAFKWAQNADKALIYGALFKDAIEMANASDQRGRIGPAPQMQYLGNNP